MDRTPRAPRRWLRLANSARHRIRRLGAVPRPEAVVVSVLLACDPMMLLLWELARWAPRRWVPPIGARLARPLRKRRCVFRRASPTHRRGSVATPMSRLALDVGGAAALLPLACRAIVVAWRAGSRRREGRCDVHAVGMALRRRRGCFVAGCRPRLAVARGAAAAHSSRRGGGDGGARWARRRLGGGFADVDALLRAGPRSPNRGGCLRGALTEPVFEMAGETVFLAPVAVWFHRRGIVAYVPPWPNQRL